MIPNAPSRPVRKQASGSFQVLKAACVIVFAGAFVVGLWSFRGTKLTDDVFEKALAGEQPELLHLRELGEEVADVFPGSRDMGMAAVGKDALRPIDWGRVQKSCRTDARPEAKVLLVTGTGGFVAMHVAILLKQRGDGVVGIDNFNDYYPVSLKRARQAAGEYQGVYTVDGDITDDKLLRKLFDVCHFSHVLHMAAQAGVRYATKNPYSYVHANLAGQVTLLEVAKDQDPRPSFIFASSSSVYGLNTKQPFSEDDRVDQPASLYAATKRADELMAHVYYNIYGLAVTGLRFFTVYGPWGRPDMAAYKFAVSIMKGEPIKIFKGPNDEELMRDFTFIDDIAAGVLGALDHAPKSVKGQAEFKLYNLGNTHPHTVTEMVELLETHLGKTANRHYVPVPATGDVLATFANISHAQQDFGYAPQTSLSDGLKAFVDWFRGFYGTAAVEGKVLPPDWEYKPI